MAISEDRTTLPEINPLPPRRPRRPTRGAMLIPKGRYHPPKVSPVLVEMSGPLPPEERRLLRAIAKAADVVAQGDGRVFLLLELSPRDLDRLAAFEAGAEDLEEETDHDDESEAVDGDLDYAEGQPVPPEPADFVFEVASLNSPTVLNEERGGEHSVVTCAPQTAGHGGFLQKSELGPNIFIPTDGPTLDAAGRGVTLLPSIQYDINGQPAGIWNGFDGKRSTLT